MAAGEQYIYNMQQQLFSPCDLRLMSSLKGWMEYFNSSEQKAVGMRRIVMGVVILIVMQIHAPPC